MDLIGKPPVHPLLFYSGKISGYVAWVLFLLGLANIHLVEPHHTRLGYFLSIGLLIVGVFLSILSLIHLGNSTRLGLPEENTSLKMNGIYRFSRNPMYIGFHCFTIAAIAFTLHWVVVLLGFYSIFTYHYIILGEERFLEQRFGKPYLDYKKKVRRYF